MRLRPGWQGVGAWFLPLGIAFEHALRPGQKIRQRLFFWLNYGNLTV
jgi:hypothetical protein